jgi:hypothetical protein
MQKKTKLHLCFLGSVLLVLFLFRNTKGDLPGGYALEKTEGPDYRVYRNHSPDEESGGVFDGSVEVIGWDHSVILAWVNKNFDGEPDGWYVIDINTRKITGPYSDGQIKNTPAYSRLVTRTPETIMN